MVDKIKVENLSCFYSGKQVLKKLSLTVEKNEILSIIGPSNSGKTSFLRTLNRMNDMNVAFSRKGNVFLDNDNIFEMNPEKLRTSSKNTTTKSMNCMTSRYRTLRKP